MDSGTQTQLQRKKPRKAALPDWPRLVQRATSGLHSSLATSHRVPRVLEWTERLERKKSGFGVWETEGSDREIAPDFLYTSVDFRRSRKGTLNSPKATGQKSYGQSPIHKDLAKTRRKASFCAASRQRPADPLPDLSKRVAFQTLREQLRLHVLHSLYIPAS